MYTSEGGGGEKGGCARKLSYLVPGLDRLVVRYEQKNKTKNT